MLTWIQHHYNKFFTMIRSILRMGILLANSFELYLSSTNNLVPACSNSGKLHFWAPMRTGTSSSTNTYTQTTLNPSWVCWLSRPLTTNLLLDLHYPLLPLQPIRQHPSSKITQTSLTIPSRSINIHHHQTSHLMSKPSLVYNIFITHIIRTTNKLMSWFVSW